MITVSGSPDPGGLLGVVISLAPALDFSGSRFVVFRLNSSAQGIVSVWINDTSGNVIRYDSQYGLTNQLLLLAIPIVAYAYSLASPNIPDFSSIRSVELGVTTTSELHLDFQFTNPVLLTNPIPLSYVRN